MSWLRCKIGDKVMLSCRCEPVRTVEATVVLVSGDGKPIAVEFEAIINGWAGWLPLLWNESAERLEDFAGNPFDVRAPS